MKAEARQQARELRQSGQSIKEIAKLLRVSTSSVSLWVRDIQLSPQQIELLQANKRNNLATKANQLKQAEKRREYQRWGRETARLGRPLHLAGCMLYWAEGSKERNSLYFVNSDPNMMQFFMRFLREELHLVDDDCTIRIHCHYEDREKQKEIEHYWLVLLELPTASLRKTIYKQGSDTRKTILENGICGIRVHKTAVLQHIYGAIQEYSGFEKPKWLL